MSPTRRWVTSEVRSSLWTAPSCLATSAIRVFNGQNLDIVITSYGNGVFLTRTSCASDVQQSTTPESGSASSADMSVYVLQCHVVFWQFRGVPVSFFVAIADVHVQRDAFKKLDALYAALEFAKTQSRSWLLDSSPHLSRFFQRLCSLLHDTTTAGLLRNMHGPIAQRYRACQPACTTTTRARCPTRYTLFRRMCKRNENDNEALLGPSRPSCIFMPETTSMDTCVGSASLWTCRRAFHPIAATIDVEHSLIRRGVSTASGIFADACQQIEPCACGWDLMPVKGSKDRR